VKNFLIFTLLIILLELSSRIWEGTEGRMGDIRNLNKVVIGNDEGNLG
jgi:hypothetical protein